MIVEVKQIIYGVFSFHYNFLKSE